MRSDSKVRSARPDVSTDEKLDRLSRDEDRERRTGTRTTRTCISYVHMVDGGEILLERGGVGYNDAKGTS